MLPGPLKHRDSDPREGEEDAGECDIQITDLVQIVELIEIPSFERRNDDFPDPASEEKEGDSGRDEPASEHEELRRGFHKFSPSYQTPFGNASETRSSERRVPRLESGTRGDCGLIARGIGVQIAGMKTSLLLPALCGACFTFQCAALAQDDSRAQAEQLIEKAKRAKADGHGDEAEELMRRAKELRAAQFKDAEREEDDKRARVKREIDELRAAGKKEEAERLVAALKGGGKDQAGERVRHVMQAVEHLRAAGLKEPAADLEKMARQMREESAREAKDGAPPPDWQRMMRETHAQMERMQREIKELRAVVESRIGKE